jgi:predicted AAA+ superfamily ATPase
MPAENVKTYYSRAIDGILEEWRKNPKRKPLLLRGARQVGKSTVVRQLSKKFRFYVEINFEEEPEIHEFFKGSLNVSQIIENLSLFTGIPIVPGDTLLFFDEVQSCAEAISSIRFFYEKMPGLHLIAAGSLMEFALGEIPFFGTGRIRSLFMYPFSFDEFLLAMGETDLVKLKQGADMQKPLPAIFHNKLLDYLKRFLVLGGMPEVISTYLDSHRPDEVQHVLDDLVVSIKADFAKYRKRIPSLRIMEVFESVAGQSGNKFIYKNASSDANHKQIREALELLILSGLVIPVTHTSANGIPLGAEADPKKRKCYIFDTGIFQRICSLNLSKIILETDFNSINKGAVAEQFAGMEFLKYSDPFVRQNLYYWHRETPSSNAEVDFVIQNNNRIIPIEIKSSGKGSMQSMYRFLDEKRQEEGIRISTENFSGINKIKILPLYAVSNIFNSFLNE